MYVILEYVLTKSMGVAAYTCGTASAVPLLKVVHTTCTLAVVLSGTEVARRGHPN